MIYLRPQKTYRAPAISDGRNENELFPPTDQSRYRVVAEALRGRVLSNDNPQLCFTALFFDARDGSNLTERLKENGFRPGWYLDGKAVDASLITDDGYTLTIGKEQLTNAFVRLTLCARDTDILLALVHPDYRPIYERVIAQGAISSVVIEQSEDLVNQILLDDLSKSALTDIKKEFTYEINKKLDKPEGGSYVLDAEMPRLIQDKITNDKDLQAILKGKDGKDGHNPNPSDVADLIASSATYKQLITEGLPNEDRVKELARALDNERKVGGRNLIKHGEQEKRTWGEWASYTLYKPIEKSEPLTLSFDVLNVEVPPDGGSFLIYFFYYSNFRTRASVRYEEGKKRYNVTVSKLDFNYSLYGDKKNYNPNQVFIYPNNDYKSPGTGGCFTIANIKLERGNVATDWTPAPEDLLAELDKYTTLKQYNENREEDKKELTTAKSKLTTDISNARSRADSAYDGAQKANAKIADANSEIKRINNEVVNQGTQVNAQGTQIIELKKNQLPEDVRKWLQRMGMLLTPDTEEQGSSVTFNGIRSDRSIFLRIADGKPSAMIGGSDAVLMAGVQNYGTTNQTERTAIYQDGTAKFGDVNLNDKTITLMPKSGLPLRVTAEEETSIERFLANSKVDTNIAYEHSFVVVGKGKAKTYSFNVENNNTKLTITIPTLTSEVYQINQSVILTLDGVTLGSWHGDTKLIREDTSGFEGGGVRFRKENTPLVVENLKFERYLNSGSHTLSISVTSTDTKDKATITKLTVHLYYDASQAETSLTCNGFRAFGGQNRYFDIDFRKTYRDKYDFPRSNPYIARIRGGVLLDRLKLEQPLDAPGCVLAGGEVDSNGQVIKSFGKYKKKVGEERPRTTFDYNTHHYTIYHSIGNTNYIPIVTSRSSAWADLPRVMSVDRNSFTIAFINETNKVSDWRQPFIYTCYKAD